MADLESRVKTLEEDAAILKGEIKSILLEVRSALLSQSNPFTSSLNQSLAMPGMIVMNQGTPQNDEPFRPHEPRSHDTPQPDSIRNSNNQAAPQAEPVASPQSEPI